MSLRSIDLEIEPDDGDTIESINAYMEQNQEEYRKFRQIALNIVGDDASTPETVDVSAAISSIGATSSEPEPAKGKRGRKPKAAVEAVAPAPIPVGSEPPAPIAPAPDTGIPPFLDRTNPAAVVAAPPPPAPVAPPPAPPVGQLSGKVIADLKKRAEGQPDNGAALVAWLATAGLVVPGATFDEALLCIGMLDDAKLGPVATQLGVS